MSEERPLFVDVAEPAGLAHRWSMGARPLDILRSMGHGCAFLDYDSDGHLDILLVAPTPALYRNDGNARFTDVSSEAGMSRLSAHFQGVAVGDYDSDGDPDLYLSAYRGGVLLQNEKGRRFRDVTKGSGLRAQEWGTSAAFADVDGDGRLDLYIGNYVVFGPGVEPQLCRMNGHLTSCSPREYKPEKGALYRNLGDGTFEDVTVAWGAQTVSGKTLGVAFADHDGSGRESLALANDEVPGDLLHNAAGRFLNVGAASGTAYDSYGGVHGGMGIDWGDHDNDGLLDLAVVTFQNEDKCVYRNEGSGAFRLSPGEGLASARPYVAFGAKWIDYDNDGWLDLLVANGHVQDNIALIDKDATFEQPTQLFRNRRDGTFTDVTMKMAERARRPIVGRGLAVGDYDNDGAVDALVVDNEGSPVLLHNESAGGHWLSVKLVGRGRNRDAVGAIVTLEAGTLRSVRRCGTDGSYLSASDGRVHFGLGRATSARLSVRWPGGAVTRHVDVPADRFVVLREEEPGRVRDQTIQRRSASARPRLTTSGVPSTSTRP